MIRWVFYFGEGKGNVTAEPKNQEEDEYYSNCIADNDGFMHIEGKETMLYLNIKDIYLAVRQELPDAPVLEEKKSEVPIEENLATG
jgi:hypothetical protein